jgi:hypothetical protein
MKSSGEVAVNLEDNVPTRWQDVPTNDSNAPTTSIENSIEQSDNLEQTLLLELAKSLGRTNSLGKRQRSESSDESDTESDIESDADRRQRQRTHTSNTDEVDFIGYLFPEDGSVERVEYQDRIQDFQNLQQSRPLTDIEKVHLESLRVAEIARCNKIQNDRRLDEHNGTSGSPLFVTDDEGDEDATELDPNNVNEAPSASVGPSTTRRSNRTQRAQPQSRRGQNGSSSLGLSRPRGAGVGQPRGRKKIAKSYINASSLMASNIFEDNAALQELGEGQDVTMRGTRRNEAMKDLRVALIGSLPTEKKDMASLDLKELENAAKSFNGHGACGVGPNGGWKVRGMISELKHYQMLGTAWMRQRENDSSGPPGGIVADQMGLGSKSRPTL